MAEDANPRDLAAIQHLAGDPPNRPTDTLARLFDDLPLKLTSNSPNKLDENEPLEWHERLVLQVVVLFMGTVVIGPYIGFLWLVQCNRYLRHAYPHCTFAYHGRAHLYL